MGDQQNNSTEQQDEAQLQIHLAQYEKLVDVQVQLINGQQQSIVLALGSASIAIPLLLGQTTNIPLGVITALLYILGIIYSVLGLDFASTSYSIGEIGKYIHEYVEPELNQIIKTVPGHRVLYWETFIRQERARGLPLFLANIGSVGSLLLLLLPGAAALVAAQSLLAEMQTSQPSTSLNFVLSLLPLLAIAAWCIYLLTIGTLVLSATWFKSRWSKP
jgi:hypothetical protein